MIIAVDNPHAARLTLHILAAVAEHERVMIGARTKAALEASKACGTRLGGNGAEILARPIGRPLTRAPKRSPRFIAECVAKGMSARAVARELEARKAPTSKGGAWHAATVLRIMKRLEGSDRAVIA